MTTQDVIDPADALQVGIFERLTSDATLMALISGVFDGPPEPADGNYVVIGDALSSPDGTHSAPGRQTIVTLHTWTQADSFRPGNVIGARLVRLLAKRQVQLNPLVQGHNLWMVKWEFHQNLLDPKPHIRHRVDRFRMFTSQLEEA